MKKIIASTVAASAIAPLSNAQVFYYDIPDQTVTNADSFLLDFDTGSYAYGSLADYDVFFSFESANTEKPLTSGHGDSWRVMIDKDDAIRLNLGDEIDADIENEGIGIGGSIEGSGWDGDVGGNVAYVGYVNTFTDQEAWVGVDYNDAGNTMTITDFAYGAAGVQLTAGTAAIPEPAESAVLLALAAGSAALFSRRRLSA